MSNDIKDEVNCTEHGTQKAVYVDFQYVDADNLTKVCSVCMEETAGLFEALDAVGELIHIMSNEMGDEELKENDTNG